MKRLILFLSLLVCVACSPPLPDPLAVYRPSLREEVLPSDFDLATLPRYQIQMRVDPDRRWIEGVARIRFRNRSGRPLNDVYVRLYPNLPQLGGLMRLNRANTVPDRFALGFAFVENNTAARLTLPAPLAPDEEMEIELGFVVEAPQKDGYVLFGESEGILSLPYSYPILAAQTGDPANPWRLDIPPVHSDIAIADPALYWITATLPSTITMVAAGVEVTQTVAADGWVDHVVVSGPAREWGMVVSPEFQSASREVDGIRLNSYYLPQDEASGKAALAYGASALRTFNELFGPYPYTELDIVEAPTRYLGMEYPGLNFIGLDTYREQAATQEFLVAHEIAHQWWYALVGSDAYRYPWLDEGLAEHSSLLYMETIHGQDEADRIRQLRWEVPVQWAIANGYDDAVGQEVTAFNSSNYEILVYAKSAMFFDALYQALGRENYLKLLRAFVDRYRYRTPTPDDFLRMVTEVSGFDPQPLYQDWIRSAAEP